jgi:hypothetical protein
MHHGIDPAFDELRSAPHLLGAGVVRRWTNDQDVQSGAEERGRKNDQDGKSLQERPSDGLGCAGSWAWVHLGMQPAHCRAKPR